ncbi:MAG: MFS transporter, partial [Candidatus Hodarchaeales archaeon]
GDISEISVWAILVVIWFKPSLGKLTDRLNFSHVIVSSLIICSVTLLIFTVVQDLLFLVILFIILNATLITAYTAENGETTRRASSLHRGTALGALGFYISLGRTTTSLVLGPIWEIADITGVFYFTSIGIFIVTILLFVITRQKNKESEFNK